MDRFLGYGNPKGDFWFVGMEEGGGADIDEIHRRLAAWQQLDEPSVADLPTFHDLIGDRKYFSKPVRLQTTWSRIARLVLSARGESSETGAIREYQATQLGRVDGETCLLELLPLPSPGTNVWKYNDWSPDERLESRKTYAEHFVPTRSKTLAGLIQERQPPVVIFYGLGFRRHWQRIAEIDLPLVEKGIRLGCRGGTIFMVLIHPAARGIVDLIYQTAGERLRKKIRR